ncbi:MAG: hypothetical protein IJT65_06245 [Eubacterium sp.]|nr:hypothetical protein [Eubacterium sp.]
MKDLYEYWKSLKISVRIIYVLCWIIGFVDANIIGNQLFFGGLKDDVFAILIV